MTVQIDAYLDRIRPYARGCPDATMRHSLIIVLRDICQRANLWRYSDRIYLAKDIADYEVSVPANTELATVQQITRPDGSPLKSAGSLPVSISPGEPAYFRHLLGNQITVAPEPKTGALYDIDMTLMPALDATTVDEGVYTATAEFAPWGVLAELQRIPDVSWSNPQQAHENTIRFNQTLSRKRVSALVGHSSSQHSIARRRFV